MLYNQERLAFSYPDKRTLFTNPFYDLAGQYIPRDIKNSFRWAEYLYSANPTYAAAVNRIARYPITDLDLSGQHNSIVLRYKLLFEHMKIRQILSTFGISVLVYGNSFMSVSLPFDRFLRCPSCGIERLSVNTEYDFQDYKFMLRCPCGNYGNMRRVDRRSDMVNRTRVILWDPKLMDINRSVTGECKYYLHIDPILRHKVFRKNKFVIDTTPWEFISAIQKDELFKFDDNSILHVSNETLPGFNLEWGLPPSVSLFRLHYQAALLRRASEAIALDYIIPLRVLFPRATSTHADPLHAIGLGSFVGRIQNMVQRHRVDPTYVQVSPIPLGYQAIGGEGKAINVSPELKAIDDTLLNAAGFPAELFYGTLNVQALPAALRLFENMWDHLIYGYNNALQFIADKVSRHFGWPPIRAKLQRITLADDIERRQILMQIAASQQGSQSSFFNAYGLDWRSEIEKMLREQIELPEIQKRVAEEYKMQQQLEDQGASTTPDQLTQHAQMLAQQALANPLGSRQLLQQLQQSDELMYAMVKMYMERMRSQASSAAGREALQQGLMAAGAGGITGAGAMPMQPMAG